MTNVIGSLALTLKLSTIHCSLSTVCQKVLRPKPSLTISG